MELRICCDASVKLEKMSNVMKVDCSVGSYKINGDTLNGDIEIRGNYIKDVIDETYDFNETVPFTLVFKDKNYSISNIAVQDFTCQEIINQGIECNFNILVDYTPKEGDEEEYVEEKSVSEENLQEFIDVELDSDELIKKEIIQKYDELLNEILEARDDNFLEEKKKITIKSDDQHRDCKSVFQAIKENCSSYRVYYTTKESDIEKICKAENVSVEKVYNDNRNSDFINKKRIIIK